MDNVEKQTHNLQVLTTKEEKTYVYLPMQFGHLSAYLERVRVMGEATVPDGDGERVYKLLEVANPAKSYTRRIIWWHKVINKNGKGTTFEYTFERYTKDTWDKITDGNP